MQSVLDKHIWEPVRERTWPECACLSTELVSSYHPMMDPSFFQWSDTLSRRRKVIRLLESLLAPSPRRVVSRTGTVTVRAYGRIYMRSLAELKEGLTRYTLLFIATSECEI